MTDKNEECDASHSDSLPKETGSASPNPDAEGRRALGDAIEFYLNQPEVDLGSDSITSPDNDMDDILRLIDQSRDEKEEGTNKTSDHYVGSYRLIKELGRGGQGTVYLAEDEKLGRPVALKVLGEQASLSASAQMRLKREAEATAKLHHPGICQIFEFGESHGQTYMAMSYIPGMTLAQHIAQERGNVQQSEFHNFSESTATAKVANKTLNKTTTPGPDALKAALRCMVMAAHALHVAHEAGLIHRDIKPGNIMLTPEGEPVILDFGLARQDDRLGPDLTMTGQIIGTPAYMSPEQVRVENEKIDRRSDVYSLGVTLYELITLKRPFEQPTREALYRAILSEVPITPDRINPSISRDLRVVVETATEKDQDRRYQTAADLAEDLRRILDKEPIKARPAGPLLRLRRWSSRNPKVAALTTILFLVISTSSAIFFHLFNQRNDALGTSIAYSHDLKTSLVANKKLVVTEKAKSLAYLGLSLAEKSPQSALALGLASYEIEPSTAALETLKAGLARDTKHFTVPADQTFLGFVPGDEFCIIRTDKKSPVQLEIWDFDNRERIDVLQTQLEECNEEIAFSPNGHFMVVTNDYDSCEVWDLETCQLLPISWNTDMQQDWDSIEFGVSRGNIEVPWVLHDGNLTFLDWEPKPKWKTLKNEKWIEDEVLAVTLPRGKHICVITSGKEPLHFFDRRKCQKDATSSIRDWTWPRRPEGDLVAKRVHHFNSTTLLLEMANETSMDKKKNACHVVIDLEKRKVIWADEELCDLTVAQGEDVNTAHLVQNGSFLIRIKPSENPPVANGYKQTTLEKWDLVTGELLERFDLEKLSDDGGWVDSSRFGLSSLGLLVQIRTLANWSLAVDFFDKDLRKMGSIMEIDGEARLHNLSKNFIQTLGDNCRVNIFRTKGSPGQIPRGVVHDSLWREDAEITRNGYRIYIKDSKLIVVDLKSNRLVFSLTDCVNFYLLRDENGICIDRRHGEPEIWDTVNWTKLGSMPSYRRPSMDSYSTNWKLTANRLFLLASTSIENEAEAFLQGHVPTYNRTTIIRLVDGRVVQDISGTMGFVVHPNEPVAVIQENPNTVLIWKDEQLTRVRLPGEVSGDLCCLGGEEPYMVILNDEKEALHFISLDGRQIFAPQLGLRTFGTGKERKPPMDPFRAFTAAAHPSDAEIADICSWVGALPLSEFIRSLKVVSQDISEILDGPDAMDVSFFFMTEDCSIRAYEVTSKFGENSIKIIGKPGPINVLRQDSSRTATAIKLREGWHIVSEEKAALSFWPIDVVAEAAKSIRVFPNFDLLGTELIGIKIDWRSFNHQSIKDSDLDLNSDNILAGILMTTPHYFRLYLEFLEEDNKNELVEKLKSLAGEIPAYLLKEALRQARAIDELGRNTKRAYLASEKLEVEENVQRVEKLIGLAETLIEPDEANETMVKLEIARLRLLCHKKDFTGMATIAEPYVGKKRFTTLIWNGDEHLHLIIAGMLKMDRFQDAKKIVDRFEAHEDNAENVSIMEAIKVARETIEKYAGDLVK